MSERNVIVASHFNGSIYTDPNVGFAFCNTETVVFKLHLNSDFAHLKSRIETKLGRPVQEIIYRQPWHNEDGEFECYVMTPINTDDEVNLMFRCHSAFSQSNTIELYLRLQEIEAVYPTQSSRSEHYDVSETIAEDQSQNNEPFIPTEEVGEDTEDELDEVRLEHLFGASDDEDDEDAIDVATQATNVQPIMLYNPPSHMQNTSLENIQPINVFGDHIPTPSGEGIEVGNEYENKEACVFAFQLWHITNNIDYVVKKSDHQRYVIECPNPSCTFK